MKENKGITLVALVITIIILIILAGVSINLIMGQDGLIEKAKKGAGDYQNAASDEQNMLDNLLTEINQVSNTPYDNPYVPIGFIHTEGTWNNGYTIKETSSGSEFVWVPCVLEQREVRQGDTVVTFGKALPATTSNADPLYKYNQLNLRVLPNDITVLEEDSSVNEIRASVGMYGGFYIARYEAGIEGTTENNALATKTATDGTVKPLSKSEKGVWNTISRVDAITVSKAMIDTASTGVKSTLISGEAWDTTVQWMVNASDNKTTNAGYDINSTGKGWYSDVSSNVRHLTGYYAVNNIYDMSGNIWDWTTENCISNASNYAVRRGGLYSGTGEADSVATRYYSSETYTGGYIGFRPVLYK